jgi:hypothetical protein
MNVIRALNTKGGKQMHVLTRRLGESLPHPNPHLTSNISMYPDV